MCEDLPMLPVEQGKQVTIDAYMRVVKDLFEEYCYYAPKMPKELVVNIIGSEDPVYISEYLAQNLGFSIEDKQMILEESSIRGRHAAAARAASGVPSAPPRPAAGKPQTYVKDKEDPYANVGRNDPCPCGSGKKFKKCHGQNL